MQTETGAALFWVLALVSIVILYHSIKDRWNWKKIMKRALLIPAFCIGSGLLVWLYQAAGEKSEICQQNKLSLMGEAW